nr:glycosyltransferase family 4 protein [Glycomyces arizonensis]
MFTGIRELTVDEGARAVLGAGDQISDGADRRPLRVAMVVPPYFSIPPGGYGGVESVVADLTDALIKRGHHVTLIGVGENGTNADLVSVWPRPIPERLGEPMPEILQAALARNAIRELATGPGLDIVHEHTGAGPLNAIAYEALGLPTVVTMHGPVDEDLHTFYQAVGKEIELVAISERQRELAPGLNWAGMVHNAISTETFPFRRDKGRYGLFLGRFHPNKAPHLALEAAHAVGMPLILAGKCAEAIEKDYFEREVKPRLTSEDIVFGEADSQDKRRLFAEARCLLFPVQWEEPFGMVMIEAMACGTPVVALRGGAVPEVVVDGSTGYVCDHPSELADALRRLDRISPEQCRRRVAEHFDISGLGTAYEDVYRRVLRDKQAAAETQPRLRRGYVDLDTGLDRRHGRERQAVARGSRPPLSNRVADRPRSAGAA